VECFGQGKNLPDDIFYIFLFVVCRNDNYAVVHFFIVLKTFPANVKNGLDILTAFGKKIYLIREKI
jgi:hypothetical protein